MKKIKRGGKCIDKQDFYLFKTKNYGALVETLLVKTTLCGEWENYKEMHASGNNVMRNRVMRGLGVPQIPQKLFGRSAQLAKKFGILLKKGFISRP